MATHPVEGPRATARVVSVQDDIVTVESLPESDRPFVKNEVVLIRIASGNEDRHEEALKAEILRVRGRTADAQVFENSSGIAIGDPIEQTGEMLSVELGPGLLGQVYDGLQNPLEELASAHGEFLPRGVDVDALDRAQKWSFTPAVNEGRILRAGDVLGEVQEGHLRHKIMVPFHLGEPVTLAWIQQGSFPVDVPVARIRLASGDELPVTLSQRWSVRRPIPARLQREGRCERLYPDEPLITTIRLIDTFFPIARGGMACIPGPFGAGKTVLQNLVSRYSDVDVVVIVACGERAGEVVETITEFPRLADPRGGGSLMDRTVIVCNTSSMPVAAREASIYTGVTIAEYYRQMGLDVLLLADSTSRWAQAMRETSGRLEEIPGEEAFPAYLDSAIRGVYERAGVLRSCDASVGSLTMIGTVSPAGGNFEEPVTQSTLSTVKTFLGLSAERAYKRFYPAVDPLTSWSRYPEQLADWFRRELGPEWSEHVRELLELLKQGDSVLQMMQVTGEEGVTLADFVTYQQALLVDAVYLQQDAFDEVDATTPLERQGLAFDLLYRLVKGVPEFQDKEEARDWFTRTTGLFKNFNYSAPGSPDYQQLLGQLEELTLSSRTGKTDPGEGRS
ncbi:MAG: V-type ATP synthase subunit A [Deltaproteobacteria bacterium]|nr:V-type ATP synthase subunit A [Deltaproteobacteria bacterium]